MDEKIMRAILNNDGEKLTQLLAEDSSNINTEFNEGYTFLTMAIFADNTEVVKILLEHKADPNKVSRYDAKKPMSIAACADDPEIMQLLIDAGGIINYGDKRLNILDFAVGCGNGPVIRVLVENGAVFSPIIAKHMKRETVSFPE